MEAPPDPVFAQLMIEKNGPFRCFEADGIGRLNPDRFWGGSTVQEEEPPPLQLRENQFHLLRIFHEPGTHMVTHPLNIGDGIDVSGKLTNQTVFIHLQKKSPLSWLDLRVAMGLHGKVQDDLLPL